MSSVTYSPSRLPAGVPFINIQSTLRTSPDLCKNVSLQCYLVATVINIQSLLSQVCVCSSQYRDAGLAKEIKKKIGTAVNAAFQGNLSACSFGHACHTLTSPGTQYASVSPGLVQQVMSHLTS